MDKQEGTTWPTQKEQVLGILGKVPVRYSLRLGQNFLRADLTDNARSSGFTFSLLNEKEAVEIWMSAEVLSSFERSRKEVYGSYATFRRGAGKDPLHSTWGDSPLPSNQLHRETFREAYYPTLEGFGPYPVIVSGRPLEKGPDLLGYDGDVTASVLLPLRNGIAVTLWSVNGYRKSSDTRAIVGLAKKYADELMAVVNETKLRDIKRIDNFSAIWYNFVKTAIAI